MTRPVDATNYTQPAPFLATGSHAGYPAGMTTTDDEPTTAYKTITPAEVAAKVAERTDVFLVDLRDGRDFARGHIPEAISLPADVFADRYAREIDADDGVILVCERGLTSEAAAKFLASQGFSDVATMAGGMTAYAGPLQTR